MSKHENNLGRLAMRVEGTMWNAYYALCNTMEGAILLGGIKLAFVLDNPERKQAFLDIMTSIVADHLETHTGQRPEWDIKDAPEHERGGRA